jgi:hypothetical protein
MEPPISSGNACQTWKHLFMGQSILGSRDTSEYIQDLGNLESNGMSEISRLTAPVTMAENTRASRRCFASHPGNPCSQRQEYLDDD